MPLFSPRLAALAITIGAAQGAHAQVSPRLEWKVESVAEPIASHAPQLAPFRATPMPLPSLLAAGSVGTGKALILDARPSCAMPVASAPAEASDSMPVARTDVTALEHMPVAPSLCRSNR